MKSNITIIIIVKEIRAIQEGEKKVMMAEYLPICDNLFNVISLAAYFCDCVFDIVLGYSLLERGKINLFIAVVLIISGSLIVSQVDTCHKVKFILSHIKFFSFLDCLTKMVFKESKIK